MASKIRDGLGVNWEFYEREMRGHSDRVFTGPEPGIVPYRAPLLREILLGMGIGLAAVVIAWVLWSVGDWMARNWAPQASSPCTMHTPTDCVR